MYCCIKSYIYICITKEKNTMISTSTISELNAKMVKIAEANGLTIEQFKKLSRKKFIAMCNTYNNK